MCQHYAKHLHGSHQRDPHSNPGKDTLWCPLYRRKPSLQKGESLLRVAWLVVTKLGLEPKSDSEAWALAMLPD